MNNNLLIISGITVSLLVVILLFKLNKTKIEYDNKLLVLNRKVRDLTNLVDLSNTKNTLIENSQLNNQEVVNNSPAAQAEGQNTGIENQYAQFVSTNENFFNNLENYEAPIPEDIKQNIDTLVDGGNPEVSSDSVNVEYTESQENSAPQSSLDEEMNIQNENLVENVLSNEFVDGVTMENVDQTVDNVFDNIQMSQEQVEVSLEELDKLNDFTLEGSEASLGADVTLEESSEVVDVDVALESSPEVVDVEVTLEESSEVVNVDVTLETSPEVADADVDVTLEEQESIDFENLDNLNVKDLQEICRQNKLKVKGRKDELIERIKNHFSLSKL